MIVLGVDPGKDGGLAVVESGTGKLLDYSRMPKCKVFKKTLVNARALDQWLDLVKPFDVALIENVHAMPKQGVTSSFSFGRSTGAVEAVVQCHCAFVDWIAPQVWKKHHQLRRDKSKSLELAQALWPNTVNFNIKANDGIAEAALLAQWWIDIRMPDALERATT